MSASSTDFEKGMIAICTFSSLSNILASFMLFWIATNPGPNKTIARLIMNLLVSDWLQSFGFLMSFNWLAKGKIQQGKYCQLQGVIINVGDLTSGFWATSICLHTYLLIVNGREPKNLLKILMKCIWPISILISLIGLLIQHPNDPFYTSASGAWCWIGPNYKEYRVILHYGILIVFAIIMIFLYSWMFLNVYRRQERVEMEATRKVFQKTNKKLICYPTLYLVLVLPLGLERFLSLGGTILPFSYLIAAACIFTSAGTVNSIIYGITRNVVSVKPVREFVPKIKRHLSTIVVDPQSLNANGVESHYNAHIYVEAEIGNLNEKSEKNNIVRVPSIENFHALTCSVPVQPLESIYRPSSSRNKVYELPLYS
ncbi:7122_t:CDS:2 [Ambispora leptoticha]|uniref:7122_t:CDS:1 n=1 Tax=Ambispora leptoticha TaxID=144679 RepID=A0A9N8VA50_9GLOM|nr:7122_t:CDS:2 [Ambispora leptoticha]